MWSVLQREISDGVNLSLYTDAMRRILTITFLFVTCGLVQAQQVNYEGTSVANFLKIPVGARNMALSGAALTVPYDATALFWNPGLLPLLSGRHFTFSHIPWLVDTQVNYVGFVYQWNAAAAGLDLHFFDSGDIEETTLQEQDGTGRFIRTSSFALGVAAGRSFTDRFSTGVKVKYIYEKLAHTLATGYAMDIGAVFHTGILQNLRLAFVLANFGGRMQFKGRNLEIIVPVPDNPEGKSVAAILKTETWDLPLTFRIGLSSDIISSKYYLFTLHYSVLDTRDYMPRHLMGAEILLLDVAYLRGGYMLRKGEHQMSGGVGIYLQRTGLGLQMDYGFVQHEFFPVVHQVTMGLKF